MDSSLVSRVAHAPVDSGLKEYTARTIAAVRAGASFVGVELEPRWFDLSCRRIEEAYKQPRLFAEPPPKPVQQDLLAANDQQGEDAA